MKTFWWPRPGFSLPFHPKCQIYTSKVSQKAKSKRFAPEARGSDISETCSFHWPEFKGLDVHHFPASGHLHPPNHGIIQVGSFRRSLVQPQAQRRVRSEIKPSYSGFYPVPRPPCCFQQDTILPWRSSPPLDVQNKQNKLNKWEKKNYSYSKYHTVHLDTCLRSSLSTYSLNNYADILGEYVISCGPYWRSRGLGRICILRRWQLGKGWKEYEPEMDIKVEIISRMEGDTTRNQIWGNFCRKNMTCNRFIALSVFKPNTGTFLRHLGPDHICVQCPLSWLHLLSTL